MLTNLTSWLAGVDWAELIRRARTAAGLPAESAAADPIRLGELQAALDRCLPEAADKRVTLERLVELAGAYREAGKVIVFTNGCFDLLHGGHVGCLEEAARLGDVLIVAVNSDAGVRRLKGPGRPVLDSDARAALLCTLACVTHVVVFDEPTPHDLIRRLRPDVLVKGGDYTTEQVVGRELVEAYGGKVCVTARVESPSTSQIVKEV